MTIFIENKVYCLFALSNIAKMVNCQDLKPNYILYGRLHQQLLLIHVLCNIDYDVLCKTEVNRYNAVFYYSTHRLIGDMK